MRNRSIPKPVRLRYRLDRRLQGMPQIKNEKVGRDQIEKILEEDSNAIFKDGGTMEEFMAGNGFAYFGGDIRLFVSDIEQRKEINFLCLMYVGKSFNHLESPYRNPDLSFLVLISRLNTFARRIEELTGKMAKITIATENGLFDRYVLGTSVKTSNKMVLQAKRLARLFNLEKIEFKSLSSFLPKNFVRLADEELDKLTKAQISGKNKELGGVFDVLLLSSPTKSFGQAVRIYSDRKLHRRIEKWAFSASLKYLAFTKARYSIDFWKKLAERYIRSSVSPKSGILNFKYNIGRVAPLHGVAVIGKSGVSTERFYDLVKQCKDSGRISLFRFDNMPFFFKAECKR